MKTVVLNWTDLMSAGERFDWFRNMTNVNLDWQLDKQFSYFDSQNLKPI